MSDIKEKLRSLQRASHADATTNFIADEILAQHGIVKLAGENGACLLREKVFPLDFIHGGCALGDFVNLSADDFACINKKELPAQIEPQNFLFFDCETTGLAGGSGTYIFLLGFGYFSAGRFVVRQYFLTEYKDEPALLAECANLLREHRAIISFNGKSYDMPLLMTRFIMNRISVPPEQAVHIDLLHASRRLWKKAIGECSLGNIEKNILGFVRKDDIPSAKIPRIFFQFLQDMDLTPVIPVFKHNAIDILSMVSIAVRAAAAFEFSARTDEKADKISLFRTYTAIGRFESAIKLAENSFQDQEESLLHYSYLLKRLNKYNEAVSLWDSLTFHKSFVEKAYLELAKFYEHKVFNYSKALDVVDKACKRVEFLRELFPDRCNSVENWNYRRDRLIRKKAAALAKPDNKTVAHAAQDIVC